MQLKPAHLYLAAHTHRSSVRTSLRAFVLSHLYRNLGLLFSGQGPLAGAFARSAGPSFKWSCEPAKERACPQAVRTRTRVHTSTRPADERAGRRSGGPRRVVARGRAASNARRSRLAGGGRCARGRTPSSCTTACAVLPTPTAACLRLPACARRSHCISGARPPSHTDSFGAVAVSGAAAADAGSPASSASANSKWVNRRRRACMRTACTPALCSTARMAG